MNDILVIPAAFSGTPVIAVVTETTTTSSLQQVWRIPQSSGNNRRLKRQRHPFLRSSDHSASSLLTGSPDFYDDEDEELQRLLWIGDGNQSNACPTNGVALPQIGNTPVFAWHVASVAEAIPMRLVVCDTATNSAVAQGFVRFQHSQSDDGGWSPWWN